MEILEKIFRLSCTEGGYTGRSLALVSRSVNITSRTARFDCVQITRQPATQLPQFLTSYNIQREAASVSHLPIPRIRHLILASGRRERSRVGRNIEDATDGELRTCQRAVNAVIAFAAPNLHTLTLVNGFRAWDYELGLPASLGTTAFPVLRELSIVGGFALGFAPVLDRVQWVLPTNEEAFPELPHLERLHVTGCPSSLDLRRWARRAPNLHPTSVSAHSLLYACESYSRLRGLISARVSSRGLLYSKTLRYTPHDPTTGCTHK